MFHIYKRWQRQKRSGFLFFSGGIEVEHLLKISEKFIYKNFKKQLPMNASTFLPSKYGTLKLTHRRTQINAKHLRLNFWRKYFKWFPAFYYFR